jgi:putative endonuclease
MSDNRLKGVYGEKIAAEFLEAKGWQITALNLRLGRSEVDVVAKDGTEWVFVEVKTRTAGGEFRPEDGLTPAKLKSLFRAADRFVEKYGLWDSIVRFDFVAVELVGGQTRVLHFPDAFRRDDTLDEPSTRAFDDNL